ncbi:MAG TPA: amino acid ABC transporter substrate-binding protein [Streptosporangiaceae bacterium]|nr:amino acid ABC transporter substrate-binding protein [Streptosporangiaceae bacterium]
MHAVISQRRRRTRVALAGLVMACATSACGTPGASADGPLRVGSALAMTGALATEGRLTQQGYQYCQDVINTHGGVLVGRRHLMLAISYQDDQSSPTASAQIVQQFNDQGIRLILGPYGSEANATVAAMAQINGQVMIDAAGADDGIFRHGYTRVFGVESPASKYGTSIIDAVVQDARPGPKTVTVVSADDTFSQAVARSAIRDVQRRGLRVFPLVTFPAGATDLSSVVTQLRAEHPDLVLESGHFVEGAALVLQAAQLGLRTEGIGETVAPTDPAFVGSLGRLANGVIGSTQWVSTWLGQDRYFGTAVQYAGGFQAKFGFVPDYHVAEASAACLALVLAIEHAGSTDPAAVAAALRRLSVNSFFGQILFAKDGQDTNRRMAVIQVQHGHPVTVWPPNLAQAPLVWPATAAP